jgi:hypothetical protein
LFLKVYHKEIKPTKLYHFEALLQIRGKVFFGRKRRKKIQFFDSGFSSKKNLEAFG